MMSRIAVLLLLVCTALQAQEQPAADPLLAGQRLAAVLRRATNQYDRGDFKGAIALLDTLRGEAANDLSVLNLRAAALTKTGQYEQAALIFRRITDADPDYFPAAFNVAEVQFLSGDREGALEAFRNLRRRDPQNELLRFKVFVCQLSLGRTEEAAKTAGAMQRTGLTPSWYYAEALLARRGGDEAKARKHLKAARSLYGENSCRLFDESVASAGL